jgi:hypothetical protein
MHIVQCLLVLSLSYRTNGWSGIGHDEIGIIALENFNSTETEVYLKNLFETSDVREIMSGRWADQVSDDRPWTKKLHYFNTPYRQCSLSFSIDRDCFGGCVVPAISQYTLVAIDSSSTRRDRQEAFKFLIHFFGDIHCPMHGGFAKDAGGNDIAISGMAEPQRYPTTLHNVWDYHLVLRVRTLETVNEDISTKVDEDFTNPIDLSKIEEFSSLIAKETASIACKQAYMHSNGTWIEDGDALEETYWVSMTEIAAVQLHKAGVRLAKFLDAVVAASSQVQSTKSGIHCGSITASIFLILLSALCFIPLT